MDATIVAVGSELLGVERVDTNSLYLTAELQRFGFRLRNKIVVGDTETEIAEALRAAVAGSSVVLVTGGLGPTQDDLTRQATATAFGLTLTRDEQIVEVIRQRFRQFGREMPAVNARQADRLANAEILDNPHGTAPGQRIDLGGHVEDRGEGQGEVDTQVDTPGTAIFLLPGVPSEMKAMVQSAVVPWLEQHGADETNETVVFRVACLPESEVEERIEPLYQAFGREAIAVLASPGDVRVHVTANGSAGARADRLQHGERLIEQALGDSVYGRGDDGSLESTVGDLLAKHGWTIACGESCTGGLVAERLTRVAGSSRYFLGAHVTYTNELKSSWLGVPSELLQEHGAVSRPVVAAMAEGARRAAGADLGVALSGVAGPGGGSEEKPAGTVWIGWSGELAGMTGEAQYRFPGNRTVVRLLASQWALDGVRRRVLDCQRASRYGRRDS